MVSKFLYCVTMASMLFGFGSNWNCVCVVDHEKPIEKEYIEGSPGCYNPGSSNSQPQPMEFTIIIEVFGRGENGHGRAALQAEELRRNRIKNYVYELRNGCWVVSVGRFKSVDAARRMQRVLMDRGYSDTRVIRPLTDRIPECLGIR